MGDECVKPQRGNDLENINKIPQVIQAVENLKGTIDIKFTNFESSLTHIKELMDMRITNSERALTLQAKEYERRLDGLNSEASKLVDMQARYVTREVYDVQHDKLATEVYNLQKIVYIGMGILGALQFVLRFIK